MSLILDSNNSSSSPHVLASSLLLLLVQLVDVGEHPVVIMTPENWEAVIAGSNDAALSCPHTGKVGEVLMLHSDWAVKGGM